MTAHQRHYWIANRGVVKPIRVEVEQDPSDGHWHAIGPHLIWGCGDSLPDAIEDYRSALYEYRDVLRDLTLSPGLDDALDWLEEHIVGDKPVSFPASPQSR